MADSFAEVLLRLQAPTPYAVRPGAVRFLAAGKGGRFEAEAVPYLERHVILARFDEVLAGGAWQSDVESIDLDGRIMKCRLSILTAEGWISRADVGGPLEEPNDAQPAAVAEYKQATTDALKRAAYLFGVGRFLSGCTRWHPCEGRNRRKPAFVAWIDDPVPVIDRLIALRTPALPPQAGLPGEKRFTFQDLQEAAVAHLLGWSNVIAECQGRFSISNPRELSESQLAILVGAIQDGQVRAAA